MTKKPNPSDDLIPRSMLPDRSVIPAGREFGAGAPKPKPRPPIKKAKGGRVRPRPTPTPIPTPLPGSEKMRTARSGGVMSSASRRADGIAKKGKTRGKMV